MVENNRVKQKWKNVFQFGCVLCNFVYFIWLVHVHYRYFCTDSGITFPCISLNIHNTKKRFQMKAIYIFVQWTILEKT